MKLALIYPPVADPTAPYISVPALTGYLRGQGLDVLPIDANVEGVDWLLQPSTLSRMSDRLRDRLARLEKKNSLTHKEQLMYLALWEAQGDAQAAPQGIAEALTILRQPDNPRFYNPADYEAAIATVESALRLVSAAYSPLALSFRAYQTPFAMLNTEEIRTDAQAEHNPFYAYYLSSLIPLLEREQAGMVGISIAFPGQLQQAFTLAYIIREKLPAVYLTAGGPAFTQLFAGLTPEAQERLRPPFHSIVLYEGEEALLELVRGVESGRYPEGMIHGTQGLSVAELPAPDFYGLPLGKYLAPSLVLPYDTSRGCYWGRCAFCHYGLARQGTACYRERTPGQIMQDLSRLSTQYGTSLFYFSEDTLAPALAVKLARVFIERKVDWQWSSDIRPEAALTAETGRLLAEGGAISLALGMESAAPRILKLINKGVTVEQATTAARNLASAGIAVEGMYFLRFPTETTAEALTTLTAIKNLYDVLALFICGEFDLTAGSGLAARPEEFNINELWYVQGDEFKTKLFYTTGSTPPGEQALTRIDDTLDNTAGRYWLHPYPWAGSLSTAHTLLWVKRYGPSVFKEVARKRPRPRVFGQKTITARSRFDLYQLQELVTENEAAIWHEMLYKKRYISRAAYNALASRVAAVEPHSCHWRLSAGEEPQKLKRSRT